MKNFIATLLLVLFASIIIPSLSTAIACPEGWTQVGNRELVSNTCRISFSFFGIVTVHSGMRTYIYSCTDGTNTQHFYQYERCGKNNGSWDWFWE